MKPSFLLQPTVSIGLLRMLAAIIFILHGGARLYEGTVNGFGEFLTSKGIPAGTFVAWFVTVFEIIGGTAMFLRYAVKIFCIIEICILLGGIFLVHLQNGWFRVGATLNGIEYSVVLIGVLLAIFIAERKNDLNIKPLL
jgi:putative oxidoreductase